MLFDRAKAFRDTPLSDEKMKIWRASNEKYRFQTSIIKVSFERTRSWGLSVTNFIMVDAMVGATNAMLVRCFILWRMNPVLRRALEDFIALTPGGRGTILGASNYLTSIFPDVHVGGGVVSTLGTIQFSFTFGGCIYAVNVHVVPGDSPLIFSLKVSKMWTRCAWTISPTTNSSSVLAFPCV